MPVWHGHHRHGILGVGIRSLVGHPRVVKRISPSLPIIVGILSYRGSMFRIWHLTYWGGSPRFFLLIGRGYIITQSIFLRPLLTRSVSRAPVTRQPTGSILERLPDVGRMIRLTNLIGLVKRCLAILYPQISGRCCAMNRREAEALYDAGKKPTVAKLLEYDIENTQLSHLQKA